jgi:hypothetical protein
MQSFLFVCISRGACHQSVTDFQFLVNQAVGRVMDVRYKLDPHQCMELSTKAVLGFLWKHLGQYTVYIYFMCKLWKHLDKSMLYIYFMCVQTTLTWVEWGGCVCVY